jgi:hypothetical protein
MQQHRSRRDLRPSRGSLGSAELSRHEASERRRGPRFGRFCVLPRACRLLVDAQPVEIGSRAFDLMMALIGWPAPS